MLLATPLLVLAQAAWGAASECERQLVAYPERPPSWTPRLELRQVPGEGGALLLLGVEHSRDPFHPQVASLERELERFAPTAVFHEGYETGIASTRDETVREYGESGLVRFLANRAGARLERIDPAADDELYFALESFSEEEVLLTYVLRDAARWRSEGATPAEIRSRADTLLRPGRPGVPEVASKASDLEAVFRRHWGPPRQWWDAPARWFDPFQSSRQTGGVFTNEVMQASYTFRDRHMFRVLVREVRAGERVFAAAGRTHVAMLSPALRCAVEQPGSD